MKSCFKYHGGKFYLRKKIVELFAPHQRYIEPFFGAGHVFFEKPPSPTEIIGDINRQIYNMWKQIADEPTRFIEGMQKWDYSQASFDYATFIYNCDFAISYAAQRTYVQYRQSLGGRGKAWAKPSANRLRRGMPDNISAWESALKLIPENSKRLQGVGIRCCSAIQLLIEFNRTDSLFYLDPPYLSETRISPSVYDYEMTTIQHRMLLETITRSKAQIILSGYSNEMYADYLKDWAKLEIPQKAHSSSSTKKGERMEIIWTNTNLIG